MLEEGRVSGDQCGLGTEGRAQGERRMKVRTDVRVLVFFADKLCSWAAPLLGRDQRPSLAYVAQRGLACSARGRNPQHPTPNPEPLNVIGCGTLGDIMIGCLVVDAVLPSTRSILESRLYPRKALMLCQRRAQLRPSAWRMQEDLSTERSRASLSRMGSFKKGLKEAKGLMIIINVYTMLRPTSVYPVEHKLFAGSFKNLRQALSPTWFRRAASCEAPPTPVPILAEGASFARCVSFG